MRYVEKTHTWDDNWNDVIRTVIFQDDKLKAQMCLPHDITINKFIEKYFIEDAAADEIVTTEDVRIVYYDTKNDRNSHKSARLKYKEFDIYVNRKVLYNASNDRLKSRQILIAERQKYQLLREYHICGLHFEYEDEYDLWTKTVGYKRYHIVFSYMTTV